MSGTLVIAHTAIAVVGIVLLIVAVRINPVIVLVLGALYLGLATGLGFEATTKAVTEGFGNLMAEVGLIIGFGVLLGALLSATGALHRVVDVLLRVCGKDRSPYALGLATAVVFPSIYFDVALVMLTPIARSVTARTGMNIAKLAGALAIGLEVGLLMVLPGAGALATAGALGVPLGIMLLFGMAVGIVATVVTVFLHGRLMNRIWKPETDELETIDGDSEPKVEDIQRHGPLFALLLPVIVPLLFIVAGTVNDAAGWSVGLLGFLGDPVVALLSGLLIGFVLAAAKLGRDGVENALTKGANASGTILLFTGVAGSLGEVISQTGIRDIVAGLFTGDAATPLLLVWLVAALLRLAQGSGSVAAITAAGLLAPIAGELGASAPMLALIALAAAAGASFGGHVSDNSFWMFKTLLGLTTRGTFKVYTLAQSMMSVIALVLVVVTSLFV